PVHSIQSVPLIERQLQIVEVNGYEKERRHLGRPDAHHRWPGRRIVGHQPHGPLAVPHELLDPFRPLAERHESRRRHHPLLSYAFCLGTQFRRSDRPLENIRGQQRRPERHRTVVRTTPKHLVFAKHFVFGNRPLPFFPSSATKKRRIVESRRRTDASTAAPPSSRTDSRPANPPTLNEQENPWPPWPGVVCSAQL